MLGSQLILALLEKDSEGECIQVACQTLHPFNENAPPSLDRSRPKSDLQLSGAKSIVWLVSLSLSAISDAYNIPNYRSLARYPVA